MPARPVPSKAPEKSDTPGEMRTKKSSIGLHVRWRALRARRRKAEAGKGPPSPACTPQQNRRDLAPSQVPAKSRFTWHPAADGRHSPTPRLHLFRRNPRPAITCSSAIRPGRRAPPLNGLPSPRHTGSPRPVWAARPSPAPPRAVIARQRRGEGDAAARYLRARGMGRGPAVRCTVMRAPARPPWASLMTASSASAPSPMVMVCPALNPAVLATGMTVPPCSLAALETVAPAVPMALMTARS